MRTRTLEFEFLDLVIKLLEAHPDFRDVAHTPARLFQGTYLRPDIVCKRGDEDLIIEVKGLAPMVSTRVEPIVFQIKRYRKAWPGAKLVFAIPAELQDSHKSSFLQQDIDVWDLPRLWHIFHEELSAVRNQTDQEWLKTFTASTGLKGQGLLLRNRLNVIERGRRQWVEFQRLCADILEFLFVPPLNKPLCENSDYSGTNRRDIILPNYSTSGFWRFLRQTYLAHYIVVDAKNYKNRVGKAALLQVANYLKEEGAGLFGLILCRSGFDQAAVNTQREQWLMHRRMILPIDDGDLEQMLLNKVNDTGAAEVIRQKIEDFRLSI